MGRKPTKYECEMCGNLRLHSLDDTVCQACDDEMKLDDARFKARFMAAQKIRHCRKCAKVLPPSRYYQCEDCKVLETEDVYLDSADDTDIDVLAHQASARDASHSAPKTCKTCGVTKPRDDFHYCASNRDGRLSKCSACINAMSKAWRAKQKAKKVADGTSL